jgi:hypothetical protein
MNTENCEGCLTNNTTNKCLWFNKSLDCPCAFCLIKVMCKCSCDLLRKHTNKVYKIMGISSLKDKIYYITEDK